MYRRQKQLKKKEPKEIVKDDQLRRLYRSLLEKDPGANRRAIAERLHLNTLEEQEEEEEEEEEEGEE